MQVTVPPGVQPGMPFQVNTPAGPMQVVCPPDAIAGSPMLINVPAAVVAPQPVIMAEAMAAPVIMATPVEPTVTPMAPVGAMPVVGNRVVHTIGIDLGGGCEDHKPPMEPPAALTMLRGNEWELVRKHINEHQKSSGFYNCPCVEAAMCLTCCCGCVCCPVFIAVGNYDARNKKMKGERIPDINRALASKGMRVEFVDGMSGESLKFYG